MKHMNKFFILFFIMAVMIPFYLPAEAEGHTPSVDDVLEQIRAEQGVNLNSEIIPDRVSDPLLETLGEAYMNLLVPDEREYEWMDKMMGGEDSESLKAMHRMMGYRYLTGKGFSGRGYGGMMMGGMPMMGDYPYDGRWGMHPFFFPWGWGIIGILIVTGLAVVIVLAVRNRKRYGKTPLEILKTRLAQGEITKEEFDSLKQDIL